LSRIRRQNLEEIIRPSASPLQRFAIRVVWSFTRFRVNSSNACALRLLASAHRPESHPALLAWAGLIRTCRRRTHSPVSRLPATSARLRFIALTFSPATARTHRSNRPNRELRATTSRPADGTHARHRTPLLRFSSLQHIPAASRSRVRKQPAFEQSRFGVPHPCGFSLIARSMRCSSNWRTCGVGRSVFDYSSRLAARCS